VFPKGSSFGDGRSLTSKSTVSCSDGNPGKFDDAGLSGVQCTGINSGVAIIVEQTALTAVGKSPRLKQAASVQEHQSTVAQEKSKKRMLWEALAFHLDAGQGRRYSRGCGAYSRGRRV
jgi:hypothetical protein